MYFTLADFLELMGLEEAVDIRGEKCHLPVRLVRSMPMDSIHKNALDSQFLWFLAPEGRDYWETVNDLWMDITTAVNGRWGLYYD